MIKSFRLHPIHHAIPAALAELLRGAPLSRGKVEFAWKSAVGPAIERQTSVHLEGGVLIVEAATPAWGREVSRSGAMIVSRMRQLLGVDAVARIQVRDCA